MMPMCAGKQPFQSPTRSATALLHVFQRCWLLLKIVQLAVENKGDRGPLSVVSLNDALDLLFDVVMHCGKEVHDGGRVPPSYSHCIADVARNANMSYNCRLI
jgi:hypothetical protein